MKKALLILLPLTAALLTACHTIEVQVEIDSTAAATEAAVESEETGTGAVEPASLEAPGNVELQTIAPAQQVEQTTAATPETTLPVTMPTVAPAIEPTTQVPNINTGDMD